MPLLAGGAKWGSGKRRRHSLCSPTISHSRPSRVSRRNNTLWTQRITGAHLPQQCRLVTWAILMTSLGGDPFRRWLICQSCHGSKGTGFESRHEHPLWPAQEHIQRVELKDSRSRGCKRFGVQRQSSVLCRGQVRCHFVVSQPSSHMSKYERKSKQCQRLKIPCWCWWLWLHGHYVRLTTEFCMWVNKNVLHWSWQRQNPVGLSSRRVFWICMLLSLRSEQHCNFGLVKIHFKLCHILWQRKDLSRLGKAVFLEKLAKLHRLYRKLN